MQKFNINPRKGYKESSNNCFIFLDNILQPLLWIGYQHALVGKTAIQQKSLAQMLELSIDLQTNAIINIFNLTADEIRIWTDPLYDVIPNFGLKDEQPYYLSLQYVLTSVRKLPLDSNKTIADYLKGVKFFAYQVDMESQLSINQFTTKDQVLTSTFSQLSLTFFSVTFQQFVDTHSLSGEALIKLQNRTVNDSIQIGAVFEKSTIDELLRVTIGIGKTKNLP